MGFVRNSRVRTFHLQHTYMYEKWALISNSSTLLRDTSNSIAAQWLVDLVNCLVTGRAWLSMKTRLILVFFHILPSPHCKSSILFIADGTFVHRKCLPSDSILSNEFCLMPSIKVLDPQGLTSLHASTFVRDSLSDPYPVASIQGLF